MPERMGKQIQVVFGTAIAYFIETLPSPDPPHALSTIRISIGTSKGYLFGQFEEPLERGAGDRHTTAITRRSDDQPTPIAIT